jgi:TonB-linked SusC/RagA family outer membrane protein
MVVNSSLAVLAGSDGRYTLRGVPTGNVEIRVLRVGYSEQKKAVTVAPGATVNLDFAMLPAVVQLQEIVTTATGEQRKVELGNSVSTIQAAKRVEETPISNMSDLLVAKAPGVIVSPPNMTGAAPVIRIRGANSLSLNNDPIFIVDGVRINSGSLNAQLGGTNFSFLNTISPEEIEDIEIVKGPSAATLYGTQAANGVVVITTKKGRAGSARWTYYAEGASVQDRNTYPATFALWGHTPAGKITRCQLATESPTTCIADSLTSINVAMDPAIRPFQNGHNSNFGTQVSGGSDAVRFFTSGEIFNETGTYHMPTFAQQFLRDSMQTPLHDEWVNPEALQRTNVRVNLNAAVNPKFDLAVNTGFSKSDQRAPNVDNNITGIGGLIYLTSGTASCNFDYTCVGPEGESLRGFARFSPAQIFQQVTEEGIQRLTGSVDAQWRPLTWMQNSGTVGIDYAGLNYTDTCQFAQCPAFGTDQLGFVADNHLQNRNFTAKAVSNMSWTPRTWANLKTSVGGDYVNTEQDNTNVTGSTLPPGATRPQDAATLSANNSQLPTAVKTLGVYVQEQAGLRDRLFLTVAVRTDQNSAFGTNFQRVYYPKASLSWILSDESFFPHYDFLNTFRLRAAYGQSGVQPGATDALRTFTSATVNIASAPTTGLIENALGNANLKPERSGEFETGFETGLFNSRLHLDLTYYNKKTKDALIALPIAASAAPSTTTVRANLASVSNNGYEATINTQIIDRQQFGWDVTFSGSHNSNKVGTLGLTPSGAPNKTIGTGTIRDSTGFPVNGVFLRPFHFSDANNDGIIQSSEVTVDTGVVYMAYSAPRDLASVQSGFDLFRRKLRINVLMDYKGGYSLFNSTEQFVCQQSPKACQEDQDKSVSLARQARAVANSTGTIVNGVRFTTPIGYWENGQFWRLRELSATIQMPGGLATRFRARDANLTLGARNLHVWTKYDGIDPEANYASGQTGLNDVQTDFITQPPKTYFTARLNLHY